MIIYIVCLDKYILKQRRTKILMTLLTLQHPFIPLSGESICYTTTRTGIMRQKRDFVT